MNRIQLHNIQGWLRERPARSTARFPTFINPDHFFVIPEFDKEDELDLAQLISCKISYFKTLDDRGQVGKGSSALMIFFISQPSVEEHHDNLRLPNDCY